MQVLVMETQFPSQLPVAENDSNVFNTYTMGIRAWITEILKKQYGYRCLNDIEEIFI
jgi:hypothetical protein